MATGGTLSRSVKGGSEEYFEFICSPCSEEGRHVEAVVYCVECSEHMCVSCLKRHKKFKKMKDHTILDKAAMKAQGHQPVLYLPTQKCSKHHGQILATYCGEHDEVCCWTCISSNHRNCNGIDCISDAAKNVCSSKEFQHVKGTLENTAEDVKQTKEAKVETIRRIDQDLQNCISNITKMKQAVMQHLDMLEQTALHELHDRHTEIKQKIEADIELLQNTITTLNTSHDKLDPAKYTNETEIFVNMVLGKKILSSIDKQLDDMELNIKGEYLGFIINPKLRHITKTLKSFGEIRDLRRYSVRSHKKYNVNMIEEKENCAITGICQLDDSTILITDLQNENLKKLDSSYQVCEALDLPSKPVSICCTGNHEVAITLIFLKQVQFVSISSVMFRTRKFSVGEYCRGIDSHGDKIYVTCGGGYLEGEGPGQVRIYNKAGVLISRIEKSTDNRQIFTRPSGIAVSKYISRIYVADKHNRVFVLDRQGRHVSTITDSKLQYATDVCLGDQGQLFVTGLLYNNVVLFDENNKSASILLKEQDDIKKPLSLFLNKKNCKIIIGMQDTSCIVVANLVQC